MVPDVLLVGDFNFEYPREREIHDGLELIGANVHEIRFRDSPIFIGPKKILLLPFYYLLISVRIARMKRSTNVNALVLTKFNPTIIPILWVWSRILGAVFVYDLFVSLYRTADLRNVNPLLVYTIYLIERLTLSLPDYHLTETSQFADLYSDIYQIDRNKIVPLPVGVDDNWFNPRQTPTNNEFTVLYWGNFLPHHGIDSIVKAAIELDGEGIEFVFVGEGPEKNRVQSVVKEKGLSNVQFKGRISKEKLVDQIAAADICLGIFSTDQRAQASITNKVTEGVAMGKPVVTMDSQAIRDWFSHGENIFLVPPKDGMALADAIRKLRDDDDLRKLLGDNARVLYEDAFSPGNIGRILDESIPFSEEIQ